MLCVFFLISSNQKYNSSLETACCIRQEVIVLFLFFIFLKTMSLKRNNQFKTTDCKKANVVANQTQLITLQLVYYSNFNEDMTQFLNVKFSLL